MSRTRNIATGERSSRLRRLIVRALLALILLPVVLVVGALAFVQTEPGRQLMENTVNAFAASEEGGARLSGLDLSWGLDLTADQVDVSDAEGVWLTINDAHLDWTPAALLLLKLDVASLSAESITVLRKPIAQETASAEQTAANGVRPLLPSATLRTAKIKRLSLKEPVIGTELDLGLDARATVALGANACGLSLSIDQLNEDNDRISIQSVFIPDEDRFDLDVVIIEPRDGFVAGLLDLPGRPALNMEVKGGGPLSSWSANMRVDLDGERTVGGTARVADIAGVRQLTADIEGLIAPFLPNQIAPLLAGQTRLLADVNLDNGGRFEINTLQARSDALSFAASGYYDPSGANDLRAALAVQRPDGERVTIALSPLEILSFDVMTVEARVSGPADAADWSTRLTADSLIGPQGHVSAIRLEANGANARLDLARLRSDFTLQGVVAIDRLTDQALAPLAVGQTTLNARGQITGPTQARVETLTLQSPVAVLSFAGDAGVDRLRGPLEVQFTDLARLAGVSGQEGLAGRVRLAADVDARPNEQSGSMDIELTSEGLVTGQSPVDGIVGRELSFKAALSADGAGRFRAQRMELAAGGLELDANADLNNDILSLSLDGSLAGLNAINPQMAGAIDIALRASGAVSGPEVDLTVSGRDIRLSDRPLDGLRLALSGIASAERPSADFSLRGRLDGEVLEGAGEIATDASGTIQLRDFALSLVGTQISGDASLPPGGTPSARLAINSPDLSRLSPLVLTELAGRAVADVQLVDQQGQSLLVADARIENLQAAGVAVGGADIDATINDLFGVPKASGTVIASGIVAGGQTISSLNAVAETDGQSTDFGVDLALQDGRLSARGALAPTNDGLIVALNELTGGYQGLQTRLLAPTTVAVVGETVQIAPARLALGDGSLTVSGTAGETLNIDAAFNAVPLSLANAFAPDTGLSGALSGSAKVSGTASAPQANWSLEVPGLSAAALRSAGLPALLVTSNGSFAGDQVQQTTQVRATGGLDVRSEGSFRLSNQALNMGVTGNIPLAVASRQLAKSGVRMSGDVVLDIQIAGTTDAPDLGGQVTLRDATLVELASNLVVNNINGSAQLDSDRVTLTSLTGDLASGGQVRVAGVVGLPPRQPNIPADIRLQLIDGTYTDGNIVTADVNADLTLNGDLLGQSLLAGAVNIVSAEISIPSRLPGTISPVAISHVNASEAVTEQSDAVRGPERRSSSGGSGTSSIIGLDVTVNAPGLLYVRGRGLDAELGGILTIRGTTTNPRITGGFTLRRGRLAILNQRFDFDRGSVTFSGDLDPTIDFAVTTNTSNSTSVTVTISGSASDPQISFSSSPDLPEDEVIALLLFDRSLSSLSPVQAAQLAGAVATLTGGGNGNGLLNQVRANLGLDNLDVTTSETGETSVGAGRYINENIYLGVEQTSTGENRATINIDITNALKARGGVNSQGQGNVGLFFEREY